MKTEIWNGHKIRFVEKTPGEWWAVAKDITDAMGFSQAKDGTKKLPEKYKGVTKVPTTSQKAKSPEAQEMIVLNEKGLYRMIMRSNKPEAEAFQDWVYDIIKTLREETGLEGFQVFRMMDKKHQKDAMRRLCSSIKEPKRSDFIIANTIANKAVSSMYGHPKMLKKEQMTPAMLKQREAVLDDTISLIVANDGFGLGLSISEQVYKKYS